MTTHSKHKIMIAWLQLAQTANIDIQQQRHLNTTLMKPVIDCVVMLSTVRRYLEYPICVHSLLARCLP